MQFENIYTKRLQTCDVYRSWIHRKHIGLYTVGNPVRILELLNVTVIWRVFALLIAFDYHKKYWLNLFNFSCHMTFFLKK